MSATGNEAARAWVNGFTLLEMLVVLGILGLIGGLGFPRMQTALRQQEFRATVADVSTQLRTARADALRTQTPRRFAVGQGGHRFGVAGAPDRTTPASVTLGATSRGIIFFGDGSSSGGAVTVATTARRVQFDIAPATGLFAVRAA
jgi:general secretion pathway protein H